MMRAVCRFAATRGAAIALVLLASVVVLVAQTVVDPQTAEFDPSPDHFALSTNGTPIVQNYRLALYQAGASTPQQTIDVGKPAPGTDGKIRVNLSALLTTPLTAGVVYEARVSAEGPGGTATSAVSNTFSYSVPCAPSLATTGQSFAATAGPGSVAVTAGIGCGWTAVSNAGWISITSGASGSGSGTVGFNVAANSSTSSRTGTLTIAGQTFTVTQAGASCTYTIASTSLSVPALGGAGSVGVTAPSSCAWTAVSNAPWITVTAGASGSGSGTVTFSVAANSSSSSRSGTLTIGGRNSSGGVTQL